MNARECVAMLLAGGKGERLGSLTEGLAKPVVHYGGKYRIIDFALSNCTHSGVYAVGVLTQHQSDPIHEYIGKGNTWSLDRPNGGIHLLPSGSRRPYTGTADAVAQNIGFLDASNPQQVLVISADQIYKMDYGEMLRFHHMSGADLTIAAVSVPLEEAARFGVLGVAEQGRVVCFDEKPAKPKSCLVSMGIYIFAWSRLRRFLTAGQQKQSTPCDFGRDIIPAMLGAGERVYCYRFDRYWKDIGTVHSLWESNMDLLGAPSAFDLYDNAWTIYTEQSNRPPSYVSDEAEIHGSVIADGCHVHGKVRNSVLSERVFVSEGAEVTDSVVMPGTWIHKNARIRKAIVGMNAWIGRNTIIGADYGTDLFCDERLCAKGISLVGPGICVFDNAIIRKGAHIGKRMTAGKREGILATVT